MNNVHTCQRVVFPDFRWIVPRRIIFTGAINTIDSEAMTFSQCSHWNSQSQNRHCYQHQTQNLLHGMYLLLTGQFIFCIDFSWLFMQSRMRFKSTYLKKGIRLLSLMASPPFLLEFFFVGVIRETVAAQGPHRSREHLAFLSKLYHIDRSIWQ